MINTLGMTSTQRLTNIPNLSNYMAFSREVDKHKKSKKIEIDLSKNEEDIEPVQQQPPQPTFAAIPERLLTMEST